MADALLNDLCQDQVRPMEPLGPSVFRGVDWVLVLAPLTSDRLEKGRALLNAARAAGVPWAMLLSVVGAERAESLSPAGELFSAVS